MMLKLIYNIKKIEMVYDYFHDYSFSTSLQCRSWWRRKKKKKKNIKPLASFMFCLHFYQPIYFKSVSVKARGYWCEIKNYTLLCIFYYLGVFPLLFLHATFLGSSIEEMSKVVVGRLNRCKKVKFFCEHHTSLSARSSQ